MEIWEDRISNELVLMCREDASYQELLRQCKAAEKNYLRIIEGLTEKDREQLDKYISLCEDLQFQLARIAYHYGRQDPRK